MSAFDDDFAAADRMFAEAFGASVDIYRGASIAEGVTAELVLREYAVRERSGFETLVQSADFIVAAADYEFGSGAVEPRAGDRIKRTIDGTVHTFEALRMGDRPVAEWADPTGSQWIVHTKHIDP